MPKIPKRFQNLFGIMFDRVLQFWYFCFFGFVWYLKFVRFFIFLFWFKFFCSRRRITPALVSQPNVEMKSDTSASAASAALSNQSLNLNQQQPATAVTRVPLQQVGRILYLNIFVIWSKIILEKQKIQKTKFPSQVTNLPNRHPQTTSAASSSAAVQGQASSSGFWFCFKRFEIF